MKSRITVVILVAVFFSTMNPCSSNAKRGSTYDKVLLEAGYTPEVLQELSTVQKKEFYDSYKNGLASVDTVVMEIDTLRNIDDYVDMSYDEKLQNGLEKSEIQKMDKQIEQLRNMSDRELIDIFQTDKVGVRLIHDALKPDCSYYSTEEEDIVASGSIASSELTFSQSVIDKSTKKKCKYKVRIEFNWKKWYFCGCFSDCIVIGWGGNLTQSTEKSSVKYYGQKFNKFDSSRFSSGKMTYKEITINAGGQYSFSQCDTWGNKAKKGNAVFYLSQKGKKNKTTKIISEFAHRVISVSSPSIGVSKEGPSASITINTAYDSSAQNQNIITY